MSNRVNILQMMQDSVSKKINSESKKDTTVISEKKTVVAAVDLDAIKLPVNQVEEKWETYAMHLLLSNKKDTSVKEKELIRAVPALQEAKEDRISDGIVIETEEVFVVPDANASTVEEAYSVFCPVDDASNENKLDELFVSTNIEPGRQVSSVLICGNIGVLSNEMLDAATLNYNVTVAGKGAKSKNKKIKYYDCDIIEDKFLQLFDVFEFDAVWYLSSYLDGNISSENDLREIDCLMKACCASDVSKIIYISTWESMNFSSRYDATGKLKWKEYSNAEALGSAMLEETMRYYADNNHMKTVIIRCPYIASNNCNGHFLGNIFGAMDSGNKVVFPTKPDKQVDFITAEDLVDLCVMICEETIDPSATYNVCSGYFYTWKDLENELNKINPSAEFTYADEEFHIPEYTSNREISKMYGYSPISNVVENLPYFYNVFHGNEEKVSVLKKIAEFLTKSVNSIIIPYLETIVLFIMAEFVVSATSDITLFKYVDIRLFYVLLIGSTHGMKFGIIAACLECVSMFWAFVRGGTTGVMVFYNINNWLPFVIYLMTGSITGYIKSVHTQQLEFTNKENEMIRDKYMFLNDVYHGVVENKAEYKRQILGYQDSFGKIFDAVRKLDSVLPQDIFLNGILTLEEILENYTVSIYIIEPYQKYGRLAACSGQLLDSAPKSLLLETIKPVYDTVLTGETWKNSDLIEGCPAYAFGLSEGEGLDILITIGEAGAKKMSLYYMNLFSIICKLIRVSFIRALKYQRAMEDEKFFPNTDVLRAEFFEEIVNAQKDLKHSGFAVFNLFRLKSKDVEYISKSMRGMIRGTDVLGVDVEGNIYLLLTQSDEKTSGIVGRRLENKGIAYTVAEDIVRR